MSEWTAVVADDEENLRTGIVRLLKEIWPGLDVVGQAANGIDALAMIEELRPDVAFLDIRMPGMTGLAVARKVSPLCRVVFITAYDRFAVEAFEAEAVDYLLKPVERARLAASVARLQKCLRDGEPAPGIQRAIRIMEGRDAPEYLRLVRVKTGSDLRFVPVTEVFFFRAEDKCTVVQTLAGEFLIRTPIRELEARLDPAAFFRVHRSAIVNVDRIRVVRRSLTNRMVIRFQGIEASVPVSRAYEHLFRQM